MKKNNKGFSLVELIITMSIMAVLVGFIAPQFIKYYEKSKDSKAMHSGDAFREAVEVAITSIAGGNDPAHISGTLASGYHAFSPSTSLPAPGSGNVIAEVIEAMHIGSNDKFEAIALVDNYQVYQVAVRSMETNRAYVWFIRNPAGGSVSSLGDDAAGKWIVFDEADGSWTDEYAGVSSVNWNN